MGRVVRGVPLLVAALVVGAGCSQPGTPLANTNYTNVQVSDTQKIDSSQLARGRTMLPSPDGSMIFFLNDGDPCLWIVANESTRCAPDGAGPAAASTMARWAPDSSAVAFTDNFRVTLHEPDLWVMRADDGSVRSLTDDHVDAGPFDKKATGALVDLYPMWSDADTLVFVRQHGWDASNLDISSIPASGGTVTTLGHLDVTVQVLNGVALSPDGSMLAYSVYGGGDGATVHLHSVGDGKDAVVLRSKYDATWLSFSADGQYLLADNRIPSGQYTVDSGSEATVVTVKDHATSPVIKGTDTWGSTWSPTGHALATVTASGNLPHGVAVVTTPGGSGQEIAPGTDILAAGQRLRWAPGNIVLRTRDGLDVLTVTTS